MSRESSPKIEDPKFADIFTLYQSIEGAELKKKRSYSCLTIALSLKDQMLIVSTQAHSLKGVCVCVCVCVCVRVRVCQYECIHGTYATMYAYCTCIYVRMHTYIYISTCMYT